MQVLQWRFLRLAAGGYWSHPLVRAVITCKRLDLDTDCLAFHRGEDAANWPFSHVIRERVLSQVWYDATLVKVSLRKCRGKRPTHSQRLQECPVCALGRFAYCWDTEIPLWVCVLLSSQYPSNPWYVHTTWPFIHSSITSNIQLIQVTSRRLGPMWHWLTGQMSASNELIFTDL